MSIRDLDGKEIAVTDLAMAIMQADDYRHYQLNGSRHTAFNRKQQAYWEDVYQKLLLLEKEE